jgi:hypothetical protein
VGGNVRTQFSDVWGEEERKGFWNGVGEWKGLLMIKESDDYSETDEVKILFFFFFFGEWVWMNEKVVDLMWLILSLPNPIPSTISDITVFLFRAMCILNSRAAVLFMY